MLRHTIPTTSAAVALLLLLLLLPYSLARRCGSLQLRVV
jgi:hypothetical protein